MTIDWQSVLTTVLVAGGGSGGAAWLLKSGLTAWIEKDTEAFKAQLKADADNEIERLKSSLQMAATEHQVRFSKMHEKRAQVIDDIYTKLTDAFYDGRRFVLTGEHGSEKEFARVGRELWEIFVFIERHRIFLPETVCVLLENHFSQLNNTVITAGVFGGIQNPTNETAAETNAAIIEGFKRFETDIPAARKVLAAEFRKMLGVEPG